MSGMYRSLLSCYKQAAAQGHLQALQAACNGQWLQVGPKMQQFSVLTGTF